MQHNTYIANKQGNAMLNYRNQLAKDLRAIYKLWEKTGEVSRPGGMFVNGICYAMDCYRKRKVDGYERIDLLLKDMQEGYTSFLGPYTFSWEKRATMCLLMAEWIEDGNRVTLPDRFV